MDKRELKNTYRLSQSFEIDVKQEKVTDIISQYVQLDCQNEPYSAAFCLSRMYDIK